MKEWAVATGGGCKPHWDVSWVPVPLQLLQRSLETCKKTSKACRGTAGVGLFNQSGDKQEGRWLRHVTDQTDEFGKRENNQFACAVSWEAGGLKCQAPAACHPQPGAAAAPPSPPSLREETLLLTVLCCHLCRAGPQWRQAPQCCPVFLGHCCRKVTARSGPGC